MKDVGKTTRGIDGRLVSVFECDCGFRTTDKDEEHDCEKYKELKKVCKKSGQPIEQGYCNACINDTDERESKMGCDIK